MKAIDVVTLFPELFTPFLEEGLIGRARAEGLLEIAAVNLRGHGLGRHRRVDDEYRGRVMGLWGMQFSVLHSLGNLQIGALALFLGAPAAVAVAGVIVAAFAIFVAGSDRQIRGLRDEPAQAAGDAPPARGATPPGREDA